MKFFIDTANLITDISLEKFLSDWNKSNQK